MGKSLYSLILNDEVVAEVDKAALRLGTNRSALINKILADRLSVVTPEVRYNSIFGIISDLLNDSMDLVLADGRKNSSLALKSFINVKYRPTIKYELSFEASGSELRGIMSVYYRTQSKALLELLEYFFSLYINTEKRYLKNSDGIYYYMEPGKFQRSFSFPADESAEKVGNVVLEYVRLFDMLMKDFISEADEEKFVNDYCRKIGNLLF